MKKLFLAAGLLPALIAAGQPVQQLSLPEAYSLSQKNYPLVRQKDLIRQTASLSVENLQKGFLPQFALNAQASYQSEVTQFTGSIPGFSFNPPSQDQYKILADVNQLLYDGGAIREQKSLQQLNAAVEDQKVEVEMYKLKERINQLFLSTLYLDEQLKQVDLVKNDIQTGIRRVEAQVQNGVSFRSSLNMLKAEWLKTDQRAIELRSTRKGILDALSLFIGMPLPETVKLEKPAGVIISGNEITRPELKLYGAQTQLIGQQDKLITAKNQPKASLYLQGGYGKPGLNQLKNGFDLFYIAGVRFNWSLGGIYTKKKEREQVGLNKKIVDIQQETFLLNTRAQLSQQQSEIDKLQQLIRSDEEIIRLRHSVTDAAKAQLENGVITANDYLKEVNAEDQARQSLITHSVQLLQAQIGYRTIAGLE